MSKTSSGRGRMIIVERSEIQEHLVGKIMATPWESLNNDWLCKTLMILSNLWW